LESGADIFGVEFAAAELDDGGPQADDGGGEGDVAGDDDVAWVATLEDPIVGGVGTTVDEDDVDARGLTYESLKSADVGDGDAAAAGDAVDLVLDAAGVGVDPDFHDFAQLRG
jgi:hypothetical protein